MPLTCGVVRGKPLVQPPNDLALALALKVFAYTETLQLVSGGEAETALIERAAELESDVRELARAVLKQHGLRWE